MRSTLILFLSAVLALAPFPAATAAQPLEVAIAAAKESVNGGLPVTVTLTADRPVETDTPVSFSASDGGAYATVLPAGQAETVVTVETPVVTRRTALTFTLAEGESYTAGPPAGITLVPLPDIAFYEPIYARFLNRDCSVSVTMDPNNLLEDGLFELRDQNGSVLSTLTIKQNTARTLFSFTWTPADNQVGKHDLSVWWNGIQVSAEPGYLALADTKNLAVYGYGVQEKFIALSLDCAYEWDYIDEFLAMLDRQDVKVTFFMTGFGVEAYPEQVLKLLEHGHELANHSYSHPHMTELAELRVMRKEIRTTNRLIFELTGVEPTLFRPPYGDYDRFVSAMALGEGCTTVMWTNDAKDWVEGATVRSIYRSIIRNPAPGNIILAHILNHDTVEALDEAITYFKEQGYRLGTVSALRDIYNAETGKEPQE